MSQGQRNDLGSTVNEIKHPSGKSWLRHKQNSQALAIDEMCLKEMTESEMVTEINRSGLNRDNKSFESILNRVRQHFKHLSLPLEEDAPHAQSKYKYDVWGHGLPLIQDSEGKWKFDLKKMEQMIGNATMNHRPTSLSFHLPTQTDVDFALSQLRTSPHEEIGVDAALDQIEINFNKAGKLLKENWREITKRNIEIWFDKKKGI